MNKHFFRICNLFIWSVLLSVILFGCGEKEKAKKEVRPVPVITGKAVTRRVTYILNQVGTLKASREVTIRSEIEGRVVRILFNEGGKVKRNEILIRLDAAKIHAEIRSIEARLEQLKVRLGNKERTLKRNMPLVKQDLVSKQQFDNLKTEILETGSQIVQVKADLSRLEVDLSYTVIRAPFDGVCGARNFSAGRYLKVGEPVVSIVELNPLEVSFQVPEKFKTALFNGKEVRLTVNSYPEQVFRGNIFFISPEVETDTRTFHVKARVDNSAKLLNPGMFARLEAVVAVHENALTLPWESIIQTENETCVYILKGDVAHKVIITTGKITDEWAEILDSDILPDSIVILEGKFMIKDGMKVKRKEAPENKETDEL